nr:4'-phosphopantetheinyl transferase superfamily protein [Hydrogenophaga sp. NH-16]
MVNIGLAPQPIGCGVDRAPVWAAGLVGSISHTRRICIAAVGRQHEVGGIGIDVEENLPIPMDIWSSVCTAEEQTYLVSQPADRRGTIATHHFTAKEAFYKWQYPLTKELLDFRDIQITFDWDRGRFLVHPQRKLQYSKCPRPVTGGMLTTEEWIIAWVFGPHPNPINTSIGAARWSTQLNASCTKNTHPES